MPFTPLHIGPGLVLKAIFDKKFSFVIFGGSQILMDIEPLVGLMQNKSVLHGYSHTLAGALIIGLVAAITGKPIGDYLLKRIRWKHRRISWRCAFISAWVGTGSHIVLDAFMHADMRPFWPLFQKNPLLFAVHIDTLHTICLILMGAGLALVCVRYLIFRGR